MSVRERMERLHGEMMEAVGQQTEVKTLCEWLAQDGYVPPENPPDRWAEIDKLVDHLALFGVIVVYPDHLIDCEVYRWLNQQLGAHVMLPSQRCVPLSPIGRGRREVHLVYLVYDKADL